MSGVFLVTVHPAEEILPDEKIPVLDDGKAIVLNSKPEKPFRMLVTESDWVDMMSSAGVEPEQ